MPTSGGSYGGGLTSDQVSHAAPPFHAAMPCHPAMLTPRQLPMHGLGYGLPLSRLYAR